MLPFNKFNVIRVDAIVTYSSSLPSVLIPAAKAGRIALEWWKREAYEAVPIPLRKWLASERENRLTVSVMNQYVRLLLITSGNKIDERLIPLHQFTWDDIEKFITDKFIQIANTTIGLALPSDWILKREFLIPASATRELASIIEFELEQKTPFKSLDVFHSYELNAIHNDSQKMCVSHYIVRRDFVDQTLTVLNLDRSHFDFIARALDLQNHPLFVISPESRRTPPWTSIAIKAMSYFTAISLIGVLIITYDQQRVSMSDIQADIESVKPVADGLRQTLSATNKYADQLNKLRRQKENTPLLVDLWNEITRALPDSAFLTELKIQEDNKGVPQLIIAGTSKSSSSIVGLINKSAYFEKAIFTAPSTLDTTDGRESFFLQAGIKVGRQEHSK